MGQYDGDLVVRADSGRARCKGCGELIAKGEYRYGLEDLFRAGEVRGWMHLTCAARYVPNLLEPALKDFDGDRTELERLMAEARRKGFATGYHPFAERAPTGRARCISCDEPIECDTLRVVVPRKVESDFVRIVDGYLHPSCRGKHLGIDAIDAICFHSIRMLKKFADDDEEALRQELGPPS